MKSLVKGILLTVVMAAIALLAVMGGRLFGALRQMSRENQELSQYVQELSEDKFQLEEQRDRTLEQIIEHSRKSTDQVLEIQRLQDELWKANEGKDIWPCGTLKEPNELDAVKAELEIVQNALAETIVVQDDVFILSDVVEQVIGGVVHITNSSDLQGSGFVIGPRLIKTVRHLVKGCEDFTITTNDGHVIKATRAISHKNHDTAFIYVDDLTCVGECSVKNGRAINVLRGSHQVHLQVLELGSIEDCRLGQDVFSIGSTYGKENFNAVARGNIQTLDLDVEKFGCPGYMGWSVLFGNTAEGGGGNSGCPLFTMDGKVVGVWVGSRQPNVHLTIPVDVFVDDIDSVRLMFVQSKYQIEKVLDTSIYVMRNQIANLQQQVLCLQVDNRLSEMYEWFLREQNTLEELKKKIANVYDWNGVSQVY